MLLLCLYKLLEGCACVQEVLQLPGALQAVNENFVPINFCMSMCYWQTALLAGVKLFA